MHGRGQRGRTATFGELIGRVAGRSTLVVGAAMLAAAGAIIGSAAAAATPARTALPACTTTLAAGATSTGVLELQSAEVLCDSGALTNKGTITVAAGASATLEVAGLVNDGTVSAPAGTSLTLTNAPANLTGTTLTAGSWEAAGTMSMPGEITTLAATVVLSGSGEIEDSTTSANAVDSLAQIDSDATFELDQSAYLGTGSVTDAGTVVLGTRNDSGDAVNWQDSGTFTMTGGSFTFLDPNSCINVGSRAFNISGGTMSGYGMLTGAVAVSGSAVFAPTLGSDQAAFWLNGSYSQTGGTFEDTVADPSGSAATGNLWVGGAVALGGVLEVTSSGERPASGTPLAIISASSTPTGSFSSIRNAGVAGFSTTNSSSGTSIVALATSPPSAPLIGHAVISWPDSATVKWAAPASDGGQPVKGYVITPRPACACKGLTAGPTAKSGLVTGLRVGTVYQFFVKALNSVGTGVESAPSNGVRIPTRKS